MSKWLVIVIKQGQLKNNVKTSGSKKNPKRSLKKVGNLNVGDPIPSENDLFTWIMLLNDVVWNNRLKRQDIEKWLSNFKAEVFDITYERRLALWLLANFVYYNHREVRHLCKTLYRDFVHSIITENGLDREGLLKETRFLPLGTPSESSSYILYYFRQENDLPKDQFGYEYKTDEIKTLVYVDDVTISGTQAKEYIIKERKRFKNKYNIILLTFVSTHDAIKLLASIDVKVISTIVLDDRDKCFSDKSNLFNKHDNVLNDCKKFAVHYGEVCIKKLDAYKTDPLGYKNGEYAFGFFYNTPNNTLPIFWVNNDSWISIVDRHEKLLRLAYDGGEPYEQYI